MNQHKILELIGRTNSLFGADLIKNESEISQRIQDSRFLVIGGADVVQEDARGRLTLLDIAPMVLHALDEAVPSGMSGRAQRGFLSRNAEVRRIDDAYTKVRCLRAACRLSRLTTQNHQHSTENEYEEAQNPLFHDSPP